MADDFDNLVKRARRALTHLGTGELRAAEIRREGPRAYTTATFASARRENPRASSVPPSGQVATD